VPDAIRILIIDDHSLFREAIARLLAAEPDFEIAGEAATVEEGLKALKGTPIDIVLLDINLGLQQGGAFLTLARNEGFAGRILVVTAGVSKFESTRLFQRGCSGIILKHERPERLIESIREAIQSKSGDQSERVLKRQPDSYDAAVSNPLTVRERQVLRGVFDGLANKEIAAKLNISEPLVKSIIQQLFGKMGVRSRAQLVRVAVERYWKELEERSPDQTN
jgi:DNA-binding NarL/FixJ family response regulator